MSSWFGGPSPSHRARSRNESPKGYFVRPKSPSRRDSSPKRYFVRNSSPTRSATSSMSRSFFGGGGKHHSSSSYYKRRPRDGYISRLVHTIKKLLRNLTRYAQNNPIKLFMLVIVPLLTGGALHSLLKSFGIRLPAGLEKMMGAKQGYGQYGGEYGERSGGGGSGMDIGQLMNVAKMFM